MKTQYLLIGGLFFVLSNIQAQSQCPVGKYSDLYLFNYFLLKFNKPDSLILNNNIREVKIYEINKVNKKNLLQVKKYNKNGFIEKVVDYNSLLKDSLVQYINYQNNNEYSIKTFINQASIGNNFTTGESQEYYPVAQYKNLLDSMNYSNYYTIEMNYKFNMDSSFSVTAIVNGKKIDSSILFCPEGMTEQPDFRGHTTYQNDTTIIVTKSNNYSVKDYYFKKMLMKTESYKIDSTLYSLQTYEYDKKNRQTKYNLYTFYENKINQVKSKATAYNDSTGNRTESEYDTDQSEDNRINLHYTYVYNKLGNIINTIEYRYDYSDNNKSVINKLESKVVINDKNLIVKETFYFNYFFSGGREYEYISDNR